MKGHPSVPTQKTFKQMQAFSKNFHDQLASGKGNLDNPSGWSPVCVFQRHRLDTYFHNGLCECDETPEWGIADEKTRRDHG